MLRKQGAMCNADAGITSTLSGPGSRVAAPLPGEQLVLPGAHPAPCGSGKKTNRAAVTLCRMEKTCEKHIVSIRIYIFSLSNQPCLAP